MRYYLAVFKKAAAEVKADRKVAADKKRRFNIALTYNTYYTYNRTEHKVGTWMCPSCNRVHESCGHTLMTGRQYPSCCGFPEGHRQFKDHATDC